MSGRRVVPIGDRPATCPLCYAPLPFHDPWCRSLPVFSGVSQGEVSPAFRAAAERVIQAVVRRDVGSSSTARGGRASRTWSVTGSSGSVSRRLKHARSGRGSQRTRSTSGTASTKTPDSSKWWNEGVDITGMAAAIPADQHHGPIHDAFCPICRKWEQ